MANIATANGLAASGEPGQRSEGLRAIAEAVPLARGLGADKQTIARLRDAAIACMANPDLVESEQLRLSDRNRFGICVDPSMTHYAYQKQEEGPIIVCRIADHQQVNEFEDGRLVRSELMRQARLSADGTFLAADIRRDKQLVACVWNVKSGDVVCEIPLKKTPYPFKQVFDFSPLGESFVCANPESGLTVFSLVKNTVIGNFHDGHSIECVRFGRNENELLVGRDEKESSTLEMFDLETGDGAIPTIALGISPAKLSTPRKDLIAVAGSDVVQIVDLGVRAVISTIYSPAVDLVELDSSGRLAIIGAYGVHTDIRDIRTGATAVAAAGRFDWRR